MNGTNAKTTSALGPALQRLLPEVQSYVRLSPPSGGWVIRYGDRSFFEDRVFETRYGDVNPWGDYGQHRLLFLQVLGDNTVPAKTEYPAGFEGLGMLTLILQIDFEGSVRPASNDGMDSTVVQSEADEQVFNIPGCHNWVLQ